MYFKLLVFQITHISITTTLGLCNTDRGILKNSLLACLFGRHSNVAVTVFQKFILTIHK